MSIKIKGATAPAAKPLELELAHMKDGTPFLRGYHPVTGKKHRLIVFKESGIELRPANKGIGIATDASGKLKIAA